MSVTSIRLQPEVEEPLEKLSEKFDSSKNYLANQTVKEYIQRQTMEDIRWAETPPALKSVREGKSIPAEKVFAWTESSGTDEELPKPE